MKQRKQGTRIDVLAEEGRPGYLRIIRFGNFMTAEGSAEMIMKEVDAYELTGKLNQFFADKLEADGSKEISKKKPRIPVKDVEK
jgi:hypothetical protein